MTSIGHTDLKQLTPPQKAQLIYNQAQSELSSRLWHAALGYGTADAKDVPGTGDHDGMGLTSLLSLFDPAAQPPVIASPNERTDAGDSPANRTGSGSGDAATNTSLPDIAQPAGLGPNKCYGPALASAAARTGIPTTALAAIIQAEAAKGRLGTWQCYSRSPRSSAAGLAQFLSGTWQGMAESKGTWLNQVAREKGWLDAKGRVEAASRSALLALRYDADASINTAADNARRNLDGMKRAGVAIDGSPEGIARTAYLGHHLGLGDAIRFSRTGLDSAHARVLLNAQVGTVKATALIAQAGNAATAHRAWLLGFIDHNIRLESFAIQEAGLTSTRQLSAST